MLLKAGLASDVWIFSHKAFNVANRVQNGAIESQEDHDKLCSQKVLSSSKAIIQGRNVPF